MPGLAHDAPRRNAPAPVVPSLRADVSSPRDWRIVSSRPPTERTTSAAWPSIMPRGCDGILCENTTKASGARGERVSQCSWVWFRPARLDGSQKGSGRQTTVLMMVDGKCISERAANRRCCHGPLRCRGRDKDCDLIPRASGRAGWLRSYLPRGRRWARPEWCRGHSCCGYGARCTGRCRVGNPQAFTGGCRCVAQMRVLP